VKHPLRLPAVVTPLIHSTLEPRYDLYCSRTTTSLAKEPNVVVQPTNRRHFLCAVLGAGGTSLLADALTRWSNCGDVAPASDASLCSAAAIVAGLPRVTRTRRALGTHVTMTALHERPEKASAAINAAFDELERIERVMSLYRPDSELNRLNRNGVLDRPHPYLVQVLRAARAVSEQSGGAFDVTVQPLWELWTKARRSGGLPSKREIAAARRSVDWRQVQMDPQRVRLTGRGTVTLNGIAQGFAADVVARTIRSAGVQHALVDGGEFAALGRSGNAHAWHVGIQHPRQPAACIGVARLAGRSLATSGDYATTLGEGFDRHHLFDPQTGASAETWASVSIVADSAMHADALSTAVFVMPPHEGRWLVEQTTGAEAMFVAKDGRVHVTPGFPLV